MTNKKSKETKVRITDHKDAHFSKVSKVHVTNSGTGSGGNGGEFDGTIPWDNVTDKPGAYPPRDHNHDERYYTRVEIDAPEFLADRVDNITVELEGRELKVRSIEGLVIGVVNINEWLAGTSGNIQTQIDGINDSLVAMTSGMRYIGKQETYEDLTNITTMANGDLAVVLSDETRTGGRSMYVYSDIYGMWEFIGEFTFTDEFLALSDTPSSYAGADGKVVKVAGERLVFDDVEYGDLSNKPDSTITEIDDAVKKRHTHGNKTTLDGVSETDRGVLTYKGEEYVRKSELEAYAQEEKDYLFVTRAASSQNLDVEGTSLLFNNVNSSRGGISYDITSGIFTLTPGKAYRITVNGTFFLPGIPKTISLAVRDHASGTNIRPVGIIYANNTASNYSPTNNLESVIEATSTSSKFSIAKLTPNEAFLEANGSSLIVQEI